MILPEFKFNKRLKTQAEVNIPPPQLYIELGYDREPTDTNRHYRKYDLIAWEDQEIFQKPFETYDIKGFVKPAGSLSDTLLSFLMNDSKKEALTQKES